MNRTPEEKLFDQLSNIDINLLNEAMEIDSAEKLPKSKKAIPFTQKITFRMAVAAAACFAIILGILSITNPKTPDSGDSQLDAPPHFAEPSWPTQPSEPSIPPFPSEALDPPWELAGTNISIESADMLNYYSAIYLLSQQYQSTLTTAGSSSGYGLTLLDALENTEPPYDDFSFGGIYTEPPEGNVPVDETTEPKNVPPPPPDWDDIYTEPPANTEGPPVEPSTEYTIPEDAEIYYYHFDPNATFHLSNVIFFRIQLSGDGFLSQTLGVGIVDVVITDIGISEPLITLRNGDKYLSCLLNGGNDTFFEFSTHKYIEGFSIVKNFRQENYSFVVTLDGNMQADHFECQVFGYGNNPDGIMPIVGETYIADTDLTFTIDQLETYFRTVKIPQ